MSSSTWTTALQDRYVCEILPWSPHFGDLEPTTNAETLEGANGERWREDQGKKSWESGIASPVSKSQPEQIELFQEQRRPETKRLNAKQNISIHNLHSGSNERSFRPTHEFIGEDKHGQDIAGAEESRQELGPNIDIEGIGEAGDRVADGDAEYSDGDCVFAANPGDVQ